MVARSSRPLVLHVVAVFGVGTFVLAQFEASDPRRRVNTRFANQPAAADQPS